MGHEDETLKRHRSNSPVSGWPEPPKKAQRVGIAGTSSHIAAKEGPAAAPDTDPDTDPAPGSGPDLQVQELDSKFMGFGKHADKTFRWVLRHDPGYCNWALNQDHPSERLQQFNDYLHQQLNTSSRGRPHVTEVPCPPWDDTQNKPFSEGGPEVFYPPANSRDWDFEEWKDDYVEGNLARGLAGYCWDWLDGLPCPGAEIGCTYRHEYPPTWTPAQSEAQARRCMEEWVEDEGQLLSDEEEGEESTQDSSCDG